MSTDQLNVETTDADPFDFSGSRLTFDDRDTPLTTDGTRLGANEHVRSGNFGRISRAMLRLKRTRLPIAHRLESTSSEAVVLASFRYDDDKPQRSFRQPESASKPDRERTEYKAGAFKRSDRRKFPRRGSGCSVAVAPCEGDPSNDRFETWWRLEAARIKGRLTDVSMNSVAIQLDQPFARGERLLLRIGGNPLTADVHAAARVLHSIRRSADQWRIVCRLEENLSLDEIYALSRQLK